MDILYIILPIVAVVLLLVLLFYRAVQRAKKKQALFEERFSKSYDRHTYRNKLR
jgi:hypothetical protein